MHAFPRRAWSRWRAGWEAELRFQARSRKRLLWKAFSGLLEAVQMGKADIGSQGPEQICHGPSQPLHPTGSRFAPLIPSLPGFLVSHTSIHHLCKMQIQQSKLRLSGLPAARTLSAERIGMLFCRACRSGFKRQQDVCPSVVISSDHHSSCEVQDAWHQRIAIGKALPLRA